MLRLHGGRVTKQTDKDVDRKRLARGKSGTIRDEEFLKEKPMSFPPIDWRSYSSFSPYEVKVDDCGQRIFYLLCRTHQKPSLDISSRQFHKPYVQDRYIKSLFCLELLGSFILCRHFYYIIANIFLRNQYLSFWNPCSIYMVYSGLGVQTEMYHIVLQLYMIFQMVLYADQI